MTDAPERIWAWIDQGPQARNTGELEGEWSGELYAAPNVQEYVRADTITTLETERDALREVAVMYLKATSAQRGWGTFSRMDDPDMYREIDAANSAAIAALEMEGPDD